MVRRILCFGDSNTWGAQPADNSRHPEDVRWTALLQKRLGDDYKLIEEGQNGRTCEMDDPIEGEKSGCNYIVPCIESQLPLDLIIIMLGTNDMKSRFNRSAKEVAAGLNKLITKSKSFLKKHGASPKLLIISPIHLHENIVHADYGEMFGREKGLSKSKQLATEIEKVAREQQAYFLNAASIASASPIDAIHLDAEGHRRMADAIFNKVQEILV